MILTTRFRSREGFLYSIQWHETGLEAYPTDGVEQPVQAGEMGNCNKALEQWCEKAEDLSEKD